MEVRPKILTILIVFLFLSTFGVSVPLNNDEIKSTNENMHTGTRSLADSLWPCFRGNAQHTGLSAYDTSDNNGKLKWKFSTKGAIHSHPAIGSDGTIYIGAWDHNLYAINPDGSLKWSFPTGGQINASPTLGSDGTIYIGAWDRNLYAINPKGALKWKFTTKGEIFSTPAIGLDGTLYIGCWGHFIYAIKEGKARPLDFKKPEPEKKRKPVDVKAPSPQTKIRSSIPNPILEARSNRNAGSQ